MFIGHRIKGKYPLIHSHYKPSSTLINHLSPSKHFCHEICRRSCCGADGGHFEGAFEWWLAGGFAFKPAEYEQAKEGYHG